jgi:hypothetical protein
VRLFVTRRLSTCLAFVHVAIAAAGLLVLIYAAAIYGLPFFGVASLSLFAVAALAGVRIFAAFHLRKKNVPVWLLLGHGAVAIAAFALLCVTAVRIDALYRPLRTAPLRKLDARKEAGKNDASTRLECQNHEDRVGAERRAAGVEQSEVPGSLRIRWGRKKSAAGGTPATLRES